MLKPAGNRYELTDPLVYKSCRVPKGFKTDGITYKLRLAALFINRFDPRYIKAAIVHDYLVEMGDWHRANHYFAELLPDNDWRSKVMIKAVRFYRRFRGY